MTEPKKGTKQATLNAFFSPTKCEQESDEKTRESDAKSVKRRRVNSEVNSRDKTEPKKSIPSQSNTKPKSKKIKAKASDSKKKKQPKPVRFISPHAVAGDDEEDEELDDEDVFKTPEAKRARAELETGGSFVPAGALISDDALVLENEIVDISDDNSATRMKIVDSKVEEDATDVVDLTTVKPKNDIVTQATKETDDKKKLRRKVVSPVTKISKGTNKTTTSRQQKMKENAAAAAAAVVAKAVPVEPLLDPVAQARVDTYKIKTDELTRMYSDLLLSNKKSDVIMQDIYGARLDCDLDVTVDLEKAQQALNETWQKLRDQALSTMNASNTVAMPTIVEFPREIKCLIVKGIQGRSASLSVVSEELLAAFKKGLKADDGDMKATEEKSGFDIDTVNRGALLTMEMEIKMLAQRIPHGVRPAKANVFEDTSIAALWVWEVGSLEKYFGDEAQKIVKRMRKHRKRLGQQLKTLARVVQLLHQKPVDEAKVSAEEAKVGKFGLVVAAELQKAKDREAKELEKRDATEEKKRLDLERQEAKSEEKRKRDREVEEKKLESYKVQKKFKAFFAANGVGTSDSIMDMTGDSDAEKTVDFVEKKSTKIARMDATINFLGSTGVASTTGSVASPQQSIFLSLKHKRNGTNTGLNCAHGWSGRRHRDPKLGVMKLLQFHENNRPAYYGTFSTRSRIFRGGRRPFTRYSKFDYAIDSDDEWEEEEPGESLSDDENDADESDEDNLDYDDQWLAYEDEVDYMDDAGKEVDLVERGEGSLSPTKHKLPSQLQKKRVKAKAVKPAKLEPQIIGPFWFFDTESDNSTENHLPGPVGELLIEPVFESNLMRKAREYEEDQKRVQVARLEQQQRKELQEQEKLKAQEKKTQDVEKAAANGAAEKETTTTETKKLTKAAPLKATTQVTVQKTKAPRTSASAKSTLAAVSSLTSPVKVPNQIDSWFKKVSGPVSTASESQQLQSHPEDEQKPKDHTTVEVISVD
ncbi:hypothetical protein DD237_008189 [Peronospora effusa]|uniref:Chromatin assembly factor 1 subunit A dimerization domain-containing protein n=1 Tax=Peronospora effusa TaxID=542832 RepID=A0A425C385_9STRA|nr:hypothetical protein DD237_008189 [Peronospora effusa]